MNHSNCCVMHGCIHGEYDCPVQSFEENGIFCELCIPKEENVQLQRINFYNLFDSVLELMKIQESTYKIKGKPVIEYAKLIQKGDCSLYDYNTGFFVVTITTHYDKLMDNENGFQTRVYYNTFDDGDFGGWSKHESYEKTIIRTRDIAAVYKNLNTLPSDEIMNLILRKLGIQLYPE